MEQVPRCLALFGIIILVGSYQDLQTDYEVPELRPVSQDHVTIE